MPPVIGAVAVAAAASGVSVAVGAVALNAALFSVASTAVTAGLSYSMRPRDAGPRAEPPQPAAANGERAIPIQQATPPRRRVYGKCRTGGAIYLHDNANPWLYVGSVLSDGRIEAVDARYFGDRILQVDASGNAVTGSAHATRFKSEVGLGDAAQTASALLAAAFPTLGAEFRQRGCARAVAALNWGADAAQHNALWGDAVVPTYLIRGVRVYDPRDVTQTVSDPTTWKYSDNPALCLADALRFTWDSPLAVADIDWPSVATAANLCDVVVTVAGQDFKTFVLSGVFSAGAAIAPQISEMLAAMGGAMTYADGKYSIHADAEPATVWTVTDDDILHVGDVALDVATDALFGSISAEFFDGDDAGKKNTTPVYSIDPAGRATALSLLFSASPVSAQILAFRALHKSRGKRALTITTHDAGLWLLPHVDAITIASVAMPFLNGVYVVEQVDLMADGAALKLREHVPAAYAAPSTFVVL